MADEFDYRKVPLYESVLWIVNGDCLDHSNEPEGTLFVRKSDYDALKALYEALNKAATE